VSEQELTLRLVFVWTITGSSEVGRCGPITIARLNMKPRSFLGNFLETVVMVLIGRPPIAYDPARLKRAFWVQGNRFLDPDRTFGDQSLGATDAVIITDLPDDAPVVDLAGQIAWTELAQEIKHGG
jgi:hypothetical protein